MARAYRNNKVKEYVNYHLSRKKVIDKRKLYYECIENIPICKNMTYRSFAMIVKNISNVKADRKNIRYVKE